MANKTETQKQAETTTEAKKIKWVDAGGGASKTFFRPSELKEGIVLEGIYTGTVPNSFDANKIDYEFELENGSKAVVNGAGNLGAKMKDIEVGSLVQVIYEGKQTIKSGKFKGKQAHNFKVNKAELV